MLGSTMKPLGKAGRLEIFLVALLGVVIFSTSSHARGAWSVAAQYEFPNPDGVQLIGPFVDGEGNPWVLGNHLENGECQLIGPFDQDNPHPPTTSWQVEVEVDDDVFEAQPSVCISLEAGSEDGFLVRGLIPAPPFTDEINQGFIVKLDSQFQTVWTVFDEGHTELGVYNQPLADVAYSEDLNRALTWFLGVVSLGTESVGQLHALSIMETRGIVRQVVTSFGRASTGELQGLLVIPDDGRFLIVVHDNGTTFLVYDGLESIDLHTAGGVIDWGGQSVDHVQFAEDGALYVVHHPRLDFSGVLTHLARVSGDGEVHYYNQNLEKTVEITNEETGEPVSITFPRPILNYVTASTATFVRTAGNDYVLHVYDNFNGAELAIQSLATIDPNIPTHMADARSTDRLLLMTARENDDGSFTRLVDVISWDSEAETPGIYPQPVVETPVADPTADAGASDGSADVDAEPDGDGDNGCCAVVGKSPDYSTLWLCGLVMIIALRRYRPATHA